ncbi:DUF459 domain-containing protein [Aestuariibaculum suncheonense]|uniref:SGNH hydrolase-type esterase domain-containing protein n=1 Tax=Aestuariibaculum suncheonense TaxID=1028745 RepID=A0A8J6UBV1_9FLAO|nr:GDSL-type esterase/lipase family protein [Aestuariibaculum suncheonense]MBD0836205.1 hypothetical protein [Aestuariibaculum suncheonense]
MFKTRLLYISAGFLAFLLVACSSKKTKTIACVGDSITFGARLENPDQDSYPAKLQTLLGANYNVINFGVSSCTLIRKGSPNVWQQLQGIKESQPDLVIISLGTNDTCGMGTCGSRICWEHNDEFKSDYIDLINELKQIPSHPEIYICAPTPMVLETPGLNDERIKGLTIRKSRLQKLINIIQTVANKEKVNFIDLNTPLNNKPEFFTVEDGVHPNKAGYLTIAEIVAKAINE